MVLILCVILQCEILNGFLFDYCLAHYLSFQFALAYGQIVLSVCFTQWPIVALTFITIALMFAPSELSTDEANCSRYVNGHKILFLFWIKIKSIVGKVQ